MSSETFGTPPYDAQALAEAYAANYDVFMGHQEPESPGMDEIDETAEWDAMSIISTSTSQSINSWMSSSTTSEYHKGRRVSFGAEGLWMRLLRGYLTMNVFF